MTISSALLMVAATITTICRRFAMTATLTRRRQKEGSCGDGVQGWMAGLSRGGVKVWGYLAGNRPVSLKTINLYFRSTTDGHKRPKIGRLT